MLRPPRTRAEKALVGPAGEHYVLYQLYRRGMSASLAPPGTPTVDVLVLATDQSVVATVQVKTRTYGADGGWHMSEKHEHNWRRGTWSSSSSGSSATAARTGHVSAYIVGTTTWNRCRGKRVRQDDLPVEVRGRSPMARSLPQDRFLTSAPHSVAS